MVGLEFDAIPRCAFQIPDNRMKYAFRDTTVAGGWGIERVIMPD
jgi:hypothetical protein